MIDLLFLEQCVANYEKRRLKTSIQALENSVNGPLSYVYCNDIYIVLRYWLLLLKDGVILVTESSVIFFLRKHEIFAECPQPLIHFGLHLADGTTQKSMNALIVFHDQTPESRTWENVMFEVIPVFFHTPPTKRCDYNISSFIYVVYFAFSQYLRYLFQSDEFNFLST